MITSEIVCPNAGSDGGSQMRKIALTAQRVTRLLRGEGIEAGGQKVGGAGKYPDAEVAGLLLCLTEAKRKDGDKQPKLTGNWQLRYALHGAEHYMGLGSVKDFSLREARQRARAVRQQLADKVDPLTEKRKASAAAKLAAMKTVTFEQAATAYFNAHEAGWRSARTRQQFVTTMATYATPVLGGLPVDAITTDLVLRVLEPHWHTKTVTMGRVRSRIEQVLSYAAARGLRSKENPAAWSHLKFMLAAPTRVASVVHHPAMPYAKVPEFLARLRKCETPVCRALEFLILCAARTGEVRDAVWSEVDLENKTWTIPERRMKGGREHRVPLSSRACEILRATYRLKGCPYVFVGEGGRLGELALANLLRRMAPGVTVHGYRASFKTWCEERTSFPSHIIELSLAHKVHTDVEKSYLRSDLIDKRARLMQAWCDYLVNPPAAGEVVPLRA
jgi:integrase